MEDVKWGISVQYKTDRRTVAVVVGVMLAVLALSGCGALSSALSGCTQRDELLVGDLAEIAVLGKVPSGATSVEQWSGCDSDKGFAYAGRRYRSDLSRDRIMDFYRQSIPQDDWSLSEENSPPPTDGLVVTSTRLCFDKDINGVTAHLGLSFPSDLNLPSEDGEPAPDQFSQDVFDLEVSASHDGSAWC